MILFIGDIIAQVTIIHLIIQCITAIAQLITAAVAIIIVIITIIEKTGLGCTGEVQIQLPVIREDTGQEKLITKIRAD